MKNIGLKLSGILFIGTLVMISCKKKSSDPEPDPASTTTTTTTGGTTGNPVTASGFTWTAAGTQTVADSAYYIEQSWGSGIRAYKSGNLKFEINFQPTTMSVTTYTFMTGRALTYIDNNQYYDDNTGTFQITALANSKSSGNYSGTGISSTTSASVALTVQFVGIPKR
jgi:hypothetical protein